MIDFTSDIIGRSAYLRGKREFKEAIQLIESNIEKIPLDSRINAWIQAFYAAKELGDIELSTKYAKIIAIEEPELPSIKDYL